MIKTLLIFLIALSITFPIADAVQLSDKTGLKFTFPVNADGHTFIVEATGNLDISNFNFNKDEKSITLFIMSSVENNSLELSFSPELIGGNYTFFIDGADFLPRVQEGNKITFVMMDFVGSGKHKIEIFGTTYLDDFNIMDVIEYSISDGYVDKIEENQSKNSLSFTLFDPGDDGTLSLILSDDVIVPFDDGSFIVTIDGDNSDYIIADNELKINFNSNSKNIEIFGTHVVPEFYEIAPLVLATSFIGLIVLRKYKKLFV